MAGGCEGSRPGDRQIDPSTALRTRSNPFGRDPQPMGHTILYHRFEDSRAQEEGTARRCTSHTRALGRLDRKQQRRLAMAGTLVPGHESENHGTYDHAHVVFTIGAPHFHVRYYDKADPQISFPKAFCKKTRSQQVALTACRVDSRAMHCVYPSPPPSHP